MQNRVRVMGGVKVRYRVRVRLEFRSSISQSTAFRILRKALNILACADKTTHSLSALQVY